MAVRKERVHQTGQSNRTKELTCHIASAGEGPIDFDASMRSTQPRKMKYESDGFVPIAVGGSGNRDFAPRLAGHDYRQPKSDPRETQKLRRGTEQSLAEATAAEAERPPSKIVALDRLGAPVVEDNTREARQKGYKAAPRWNPARWHQAPTEEQAPLQKEEGEAWNSLESQMVQGSVKGQDRLMRTVRRPGEDVATPCRSSDGGAQHSLNHDREEYYPGRSLVDAETEEPGNDYQIRPIPLPDFHNPPPGEAEAVSRMQRLRTVMRQRYAGRPRLIGVFRNCAMQKPGFVFPRDLQHIFDQMGINVKEEECVLLIKAVDKDQKGAATFEEFSDLIYGTRVNVGGAAHEPQERHVRHVTKTLVDGLVANGQLLGKAFCELDPERLYAVTKAQFANALGTACNHISKQAVDFLWAAQFPGEEVVDIDRRCVDWRSFMSQVAHFAHENRPPTPCFLQGRKRQYDLLQRSAAISGGNLGDVDLSRPHQNPDDTVHLVADRLVHRQTELAGPPRDAALLTVPYVEDLQGKALRAERALPRRLPEARLRELLQHREMVHQDELSELLCRELEQPAAQAPLPPQDPLYASAVPGKLGQAEVMTLDERLMGDPAAHARGGAAAVASGAAAGGSAPAGRPGSEAAPAGGAYPGPACLKLVAADIQAYVATQRTNRDHEVEVESLIRNVYRPEDERKVIDTVNDGLARHLRGHRPPRERPPHGEVPRHENYWQARYLMELLADNIAAIENSNGGKLKPSKVFKRLDMDNDGYLSLSDLHSACERYGVPNSSADLHALFSELDKDDYGSVHIGEFTRQFEIHQGNLLDAMSRPIKAVDHQGGVQFAGTLQDKLDARERELEAAHAANTAAQEAFVSGGRATSAPAAPGTSGGATARSQSSRRSGPSATQLPLIVEAGTGRVSDIIRARCSQWRPRKSELFTAPARTRYGMTVYADTRHITEPSVPLSAAFMTDRERFKTMNNTHSVFGVPDRLHPQAEDAMKMHSHNEFRVERIRQRHREFADRCWAANEAAQEFDEKKVARKAMSQLNYERRVKMSCA